MPEDKRTRKKCNLSVYGNLHITAVRYIADYRLRVAFDDGTGGEVDLFPLPDGPVFEPLKDKQFFARVIVDDELETLIWPNGADLAPEYVKALQKAQCGSEC